MKKTFLASIILFASFSFSYANGKIVFDKSIHNFGDVVKESKVIHSFKFKNKGNSLLIINRVRAGCSCTGTLISTKRLKPGESGEIRVELYTDSRLGELTRSIHVFTNDKQHKRIRLVIMANVISK